jgi:ectoine hydroxylase-related dioxygenase (phytanoyl-CoA dioxygenase family)
MRDFREDIERFHVDGFLVWPGVLSAEEIAELKTALDARLGNKNKGSKRIVKRMFEESDANLRLFWKEPVVSFAEKLIADTTPDAGSFAEGVAWASNAVPSANECHVIHNNSFKIPARTAGLAGSRWHQDDTPHVLSLSGEPLTNIRLPVLAFTCLYYLTDVPTEENGPTQVVPGSHLFGKPPGVVEEHQGVSLLGTAGTVVMFNNQVWHRGAPNTSDVDRYCTQVTYAKRLVGHKYGTFMNYQMPQRVVDQAEGDPRKLRLLGFLSGGAYG